jgi:hypothetical protein
MSVYGSSRCFFAVRVAVNVDSTVPYTVNRQWKLCAKRIRHDLLLGLIHHRYQNLMSPVLTCLFSATMKSLPSSCFRQDRRADLTIYDLNTLRT